MTKNTNGKGTVHSKQDLEQSLAELVARLGEFSYDIPLTHGVWTRGSEGLPNTRLRRVVQIAEDLSPVPLSDCRVLDLGCLEGQFALEFALHGSQVLGVDAREPNIQKAEFVRRTLDLNNVEFVRDDVRSISIQRYGCFDIILCSGLLYHLNRELFPFVEAMYEMANRLLLIDTHVSLTADVAFSYNGRQYHGREWREHEVSDTEETKAARTLSSWGNDVSLILSRPSLVNLLSHTGFSSIYECFNPPHLNFGQAGLEHRDRCTFVAIKGTKRPLHTSPAADLLDEDHPEDSLSYQPSRGFYV